MIMEKCTKVDRKIDNDCDDITRVGNLKAENMAEALEVAGWNGYIRQHPHRIIAIIEEPTHSPHEQG